MEDSTKWQPETPTIILGKPLAHWQEWQNVFVNEWCRLAEGRADPEQTYDLALELYPKNGDRGPAEVAREAWDWDAPAD